MIQPVSAFSPRAVFRGSSGKYGKNFGKSVDTSTAFLNAGGLALATGGLTATLSRGYTASWAHAGMLGLCASFLTMFFMTPHLIDKVSTKVFSKNPEAEMLVKEDAPKFFDAVKEHLRPAKKLVQFRSDPAQVPTP